MIGWLDQSEEQQQKMREIIALFAEEGTVDDIGIGVVRDAFSDLLFPGLSTVQTRVRYFLLVPWVFQRLHERPVPSADAQEVARRWEIDLIASLRQGGTRVGLIGSVAGASLKTLPSIVYWSGLKTYGIRTFNGTRSDYFREMDRFNRAAQRRRQLIDGDDLSTDDGNGGDGPAERWHRNLPAPPKDLWERTTLDLSYDEASYLQERIIQSCPDSLIAHFLRHPTPIAETTPFAWDAVDFADLDPSLATKLAMAQYFSEAMHGASLLYNVMLAERSAERRLPYGDERAAELGAELAEWQELIDIRQPEYASVNRTEFWTVVRSSGAVVSWQSVKFIDRWLNAVNANVDVAKSGELRGAIVERERSLKKGLARLSNPRALETWPGSSGLAQLRYRWNNGRDAVNDIALGLLSGSGPT